uniref:CRAL-TRIO domain-containing protein n=1 Tax=Clastoptera arizonana TaxID=38151 RepID=A0A1B6DLR3_9HEMI
MKTRHPFMNLKVEIPKDKLDDVRNIRNWLIHQYHLPELTDQHILMFLHSCYYSGEMTKSTIDNYYTVRTQCPDLFSNRDMDNMKLQLENFVMVPLPLPTPEGYRIILYKLHNTDPSIFNFMDALRGFISLNDIRISEDGPVEGYRVVFDMKGLSFGHLTRASANIQAVRKFMIYIQDCHPVRLKGVHIINTMSLIDMCLNMVKPVMHSELFEILHLHNTVEGLSEFFSLDLLPKDYGGKLATDTLEMNKKHLSFVMKNYKTWVKEEESFVADLKKRPEKSKNQILGLELEGSFKSLSID